MSLLTFSAFNFGHTIDSSNNALDFNEGSGELNATLNNGDYTLTEFVIEIKRAMEAVGALNYTVSVNRTTRIITIAGSATFSLLASTGTRVGIGVWDLMGFAAVNRTGSASYAGTLASGSQYRPQSLLVDHVASENWNQKNDAVVNEAASGKVQVIYFGDVAFMKFNIRLATNLVISSAQPQIETQTNGVANLRAFMDYIITKAKFEFMADRDTPSTFENVLLEKTPDSKNGTEYQLKEKQGCPGYFETGVLVLRVVT